MQTRAAVDKFPSEALSVPSQEQILELVKKVKPQLARVLTTSDSVTQFMSLLAQALLKQESASKLEDGVISEPSPSLSEATCAL